VIVSLRRSVEYVGELGLVGAEAFGAILRLRVHLGDTLTQLREIGVRSLPVVLATILFSAATFAYHLQAIVQNLGMRDTVGGLVGLAIVREVAPVMCAVCVIARCGSAMAAEALKLLTGLGEPLIGTLGYYSSLTGRWEYIPVTGSADTVERLRTEDPPAQVTAAPMVVSVAEVTCIPDDAVLIDVREPDEYANFRIPGAVNRPLGEVLEGTDPPELTTDRPVVIYCAGGVRSARAVAALASRGITGPVSLAGGIDAWLDRQG